MKITAQELSPINEQQSCLIVGVYQDKSLTPAASALNDATKQSISKLMDKGTFQGKTGQTLALFNAGGSEYDHILLVGCGKPHKASALDFCKIVSAAFKASIASNAKTIACFLTELDVDSEDLSWKSRLISQLAWDATYRFDAYKSEKEPAIAVEELIVALSDKSLQSACEQAVLQGMATAKGMALTKDLANSPSNVCTPSYLADQAKELAENYSELNVNILNEAEMNKLGMGALLAVSQGSAQEAKLICLEYNGGDKADKPFALVGKGITFDTGGNSIKPADAMVGMKYDMCGAATVFGTIKAAAELKLPINIVGLIPAVENMPGGTAYKPEDILTSMSGQTIEVISTDAEGRLVLADALTYCERYEPQAVIDIATLTGAAVIALGFHTTAVMANNEPLATSLIEAGSKTCDRAWQLPMTEEYQEQIKSPFADMANVGGRPAGTITAGCFLSRFTKKYNWAHLDVAGTAAMMMGTSERRATGRPVPLLVQYLVDQAGK